MSDVDKGVCLKILKQCLQPKPWTPFPGDEKVFEGLARNWKEAENPQFQALLQDKGLSLDTQVTIWDQGTCPDGGRIYCIVH